MTEQETMQDNFTVTVIQPYAAFFAWLQTLGIVRFSKPGLELSPMPRIRAGIEDPTEKCIRVYVPRKLRDGELHPNSNAEWDVMLNAYHSNIPVYNLPGTKQLRIPSMLAGYPTDIIQTQT